MEGEQKGWDQDFWKKLEGAIYFGFRLHFCIRKLAITNFKKKVELLTWSAILSSYPRLMLAIFITNMFYTIGKASSVIFDFSNFLQTQKFINRKAELFADILQNIHSKTVLLESLFDKVAGLKTCNFIKNRLQKRYFPVHFADSSVPTKLL